MAEIDIPGVYNNTGKIVQLRYAQKAVDAGSTILALRSEKGVVLVVAKPVVSPLYVHETDHRIHKIANNIYMAYTGLLPDGFLLAKRTAHMVRQYRSQFDSEIGATAYRRILHDNIHFFTREFGLRPMGINTLSIVKDGNFYRVLGTDCSGHVVEYCGFAYGRGSRRAQTSIEGLELDGMEVVDLVDAGIKTLFLCHDVLADPKFNVEVGIISDDSDGEFVRMEQRAIQAIMEKYEGLSMDGEDE